MLNISAQNYTPIEMYPNPASDVMYVMVPESFLGATQIFVTDMLGRTMYTQERSLDYYDNRKVEIHVEKLNTGYYILNIRNGDEWRAEKFIKK